MISNEQIAAEIDELKAEIERRVTAVRGIFAQVAELRSEADLLKRLLVLRSRTDPDGELIDLLIVGSVCNEADEPSPICVFSWHGSMELPLDARIHVKRGWRSLLSEEVALYFSDLLADWKQRINNDPSALIAAIGELSVGPVRMLEETTVRKGQLAHLLSGRLGTFDVYPELTLVR